MKLWGGRFSGRGDPDFERFSESFSVDQRLVMYDLAVNQAYVRALGRAGVLRPAEVRKITRGLETLRHYVTHRRPWASGQPAEDVHTWVENRLERAVGVVARKLRTGRSRNDLVATAMRLYAKDAIAGLREAMTGVLAALVDQARRHSSVIMPGYTHWQPAQPILWSHYLLAYFEMFRRDRDRLEDCLRRVDELPMGAGALAGTGFAIDRENLARQLGFGRAARNSLDVTSDRDFVAELLFVCALIMAHLSRLAEDLIMFSTPALGFVELAEAYSTGSSLMPQKKNPDSLELIRGRSARVLGRLTSMLALLKGLPLAYNRDLQEDKEPLFDGVDTTRSALVIAARVLQTLHARADRMKAATSEGFLTATDIAEELVRRGMPFSEAHERVGRLVRYCAEQQRGFAQLSETEVRQFIPQWDARLREVALRPEAALRRRDVTGGTAPRQVRRQIRAAERTVAMLRSRVGHRNPV